MKLYSPDITKPTEVNYYWHEKVLVEPMPKPKQGEWIDKGRNLWGCSNCGMEIYSESERDRNEFHKWCSRCGARMKGADDEQVDTCQRQIARSE